jgi:hypothetical protein
MASRFRWPSGRRRRPQPPRHEKYNVPEADAAAFMLMSRRELADLRRAGKGPPWMMIAGKFYYGVEDLFEFYKRATGSNIPPPSY